jgi:hypothetical protein
MAGRPSARLIAAILALMASDEQQAESDKLSGRAAATQAGLKPDTLYRARLYKQWQAAKAEPDHATRHALLDALGQELDEHKKPTIRAAKRAATRRPPGRPRKDSAQIATKKQH